MADDLTLRIITPESIVQDTTASSIRLPASDGSMGILPRHASMITALDMGLLTYLHEGDNFLHQMAPQQAQMIGLPPVAESSIERDLPDATAVSFGNHEIGVIHTPGHTPGSVSFMVSGHDICLSGDTLFAGGIGRTDLWGGDFGEITRSIKDRLYTLNGAVEVVPGHGPLTTIDRERISNPFVRG